MLRKYLLLALLLVAPALAQTYTVTGVVTDGSGLPVTNATLIFKLANCGGNLPVIIGSGAIAPPAATFGTDLNGNIISQSGGTATILGNNNISCGGLPGTTWWLVQIFSNNVPAGPQKPYIITGNWNISTAQVCTTCTGNPPVPPNPIYIQSNPLMNQTILQPPGTSLVFTGGFQFLNGYTVVPIPIIQLPTSPLPGTHVTINNGGTTGDCTVGGGANQVDCVWNGSAWVASGGSFNGGNVTGNVTFTGTVTIPEASKLYVNVVTDCNVPSNQTDATAQLNACFYANPGRTIIFPKLTTGWATCDYNVSDTLYPYGPQLWTGVGAGQYGKAPVTICMTSKGAVGVWNNNSYSYNFHVQNLSFYGAENFSATSAATAIMPHAWGYPFYDFVTMGVTNGSNVVSTTASDELFMSTDVNRTMTVYGGGTVSRTGLVVSTAAGKYVVCGGNWTGLGACPNNTTFSWADVGKSVTVTSAWNPGLATATYVSGGSFAGTGTCTLSGTSPAGVNAGGQFTATIAVSGGTPGAITIVNPGGGFPSNTTTLVFNGTPAVAVTANNVAGSGATCSGTTVNLSVTLLPAVSFTSRIVGYCDGTNNCSLFFPSGSIQLATPASYTVQNVAGGTVASNAYVTITGFTDSHHVTTNTTFTQSPGNVLRGVDGSEADGFRINGGFTVLQGLYFNSWGRDGIRGDNSMLPYLLSTSTYYGISNSADSFHIIDSNAQSNRGNGAYFVGGDSNVGGLDRGLFGSNMGWGILGNDFLGNGYNNPQTAANHTDCSQLPCATTGGSSGGNTVITASMGAGVPLPPATAAPAQPAALTGCSLSSSPATLTCTSGGFVGTGQVGMVVQLDPSCSMPNGYNTSKVITYTNATTVVLNDNPGGTCNANFSATLLPTVTKTGGNNFTTAMVGQPFVVQNAGPDGAYLYTTGVALYDVNTMGVDTTPTQAVSNARLYYGGNYQIWKLYRQAYTFTSASYTTSTPGTAGQLNFSAPNELINPAAMCMIGTNMLTSGDVMYIPGAGPGGTTLATMCKSTSTPQSLQLQHPVFSTVASGGTVYFQMDGGSFAYQNASSPSICYMNYGETDQMMNPRKLVNSQMCIGGLAGEGFNHFNGGQALIGGNLYGNGLSLIGLNDASTNFLSLQNGYTTDAYEDIYYKGYQAGGGIIYWDMQKTSANDWKLFNGNNQNLRMWFVNAGKDAFYADKNITGTAAAFSFNAGTGTSTQQIMQFDAQGSVYSGATPHMLYAGALSTISINSGFGTSPTITHNGSLAIVVTVGTGGTASTGTLTLPAASTKWLCSAWDLTNPAANNTKQSGGTNVSAILTNYNNSGTATAWTAGDVLNIQCSAY